MTKALFIATFSFLPGILLAQTEADMDEVYKVCDDKVFTKVEKLPDFKNGKAAFQDSLAKYLKNKNAFPEKGSITYEFIVTKQSKLFDIKKVKGDIKQEERVKEALTSIPGMWIPAIQNSQSVCAHVGLTIEFSKNALTVKIVEPFSEQFGFEQNKGHE